MQYEQLLMEEAENVRLHIAATAKRLQQQWSTPTKTTTGVEANS